MASRSGFVYISFRGIQFIEDHRLTRGLGLLVYALVLGFQTIFNQFILIILLAPIPLWIGTVLYLLLEEDKTHSTLIRTYEEPGRCYNHYRNLPFSFN